MEKAIVTGCNGFIGSHLVEALLAQGTQVCGVDIAGYRWNDDYLQIKKHKGFNEIRGDLTEYDFVEAIINAEKPQAIFHFASLVGVNSYLEDPLKVIDTTLNSVRNFIRALEKKPLRFYFSSTSEIYGNNQSVPWKEDSERVLGGTTVDRWSYSSSKAVAEHMLWAAHRTYGLPVTVFRFFNVYGPRQRPDLVVPAMISSIISSQTARLYDLGANTRCFTYVQDAVQACLKASSKEESSGQIFNVGSDKEVSIGELLDKIKDLMKGKYDFLVENVDTRTLYSDYYQDIIRRVPDVSKADQILDWRVETSLEIGLKKTIKWWEQQLAVK